MNDLKHQSGGYLFHVLGLAPCRPLFHFLSHSLISFISSLLSKLWKMTIIRGRPSVPGTRNSPLRHYYSTRLLHSLPRYAVPSFLRPWFPLQSTQETLIVYTFHLFCPERVCPPSSHIFSLRISSHCPQSRVVVSRCNWAYRHQDDLADVIEWLVSTGHVTRDAVEAFLLNDNVSRERVDFARVGRVRDGRCWPALRSSLQRLS